MLTITDIQTTNFEEIPEDIFWNVGETAEFKMHRIHAYPAKFPAFITTRALEFARSQGIQVNKIADVFCGCGTVAYESKRNNISFWGCDINPVATMIAKTKSQSYDTKILEKYYDEIFAAYHVGNVFNEEYENANDRLKYWYCKEQYLNLLSLKKIIEEVVQERSKYRLFFLCAFSNILKGTSRWLTKSIKPQVDPDKKISNVWKAFEYQCKFMISANAESDIVSEAETTIVNANFLDAALVKPKTDMIVTSPPYVTSYEYADLHQLSSLWLDYADDYRILREGTIGSLHHVYNFEKDLTRLNNCGANIVSKLIENDKSKAKSVAKYFLDMQKVANTTYGMLNDGGLAIFIIGDTEYKQVRIENARHLVESLLESGFKRVDVAKRKISRKILTPYRDKKGKFTTDKNNRKVYAEEFIVMGRK